MKLICPVSGTENENREECKQCGTDLRPLIMVSEFPGHSLQEGAECLAQGQLTEAVEKLSTAVTLYPDSAEIHFKLAEALTRIGLEKPSLDHLDRAATLAPNRADIRDARETLIQAQKKAATGTELDMARQRRQRLLLRYVPVGTLLLGVLFVVGLQAALRWRQPRSDWPGIVRRRLDTDPITRTLHLKVATRDGVVQIAGEVPSEVYRDLVFEVAGRDVPTRVDINQLGIAPPSPVGTYQVRAGDSWWTIARRKYGSALVWPQLAKENRSQNAAPLSLRPGERVDLPPITITPH